jgi:hypothetical protein
MIRTMTVADEISGRMTGSGLFLFGWEEPPSMVDWLRKDGVGKTADPWMAFIAPVEKERSTCQSTKIFASRWETEFTPLTDLGAERVRKAIALLDQWLNDDSGYDEETWPELKKSLDRERLSNRRLFDAERDPS